MKNKSSDPRLRVLAERVSKILERYDSDAEVSRLTGIPPNTVARMKGGKNEPGILGVLTFSEKLAIPLEWLIGLVDEPAPNSCRPVAHMASDFVTVHELDAKAAAGPGAVTEVVKEKGSFPFPARFLTKLLDAEDVGRAYLSSVRANGDSMEPTIRNGALIIIDEAQNRLPEPPTTLTMRRAEADIYVFITSEGVRLKRLKRINNDFVAIISDNPRKYPVEIFDRNEDKKLAVMGKVIWWDNRL
jgi:hypothetical protein